MGIKLIRRKIQLILSHHITYDHRYPNRLVLLHSRTQKLEDDLMKLIDSELQAAVNERLVKTTKTKKEKIKPTE